MSEIKLITCCGVHYDVDLLSHFFEHYYSLGVKPENFMVILNTRDRHSWDYKDALNICGAYEVHPKMLWVGEYTSQEMWERRLKVIKENTKPEDWIIHADTDEFHEYDALGARRNIPQIVEEAESRKINAIQGVYTDRIAADGSLPVIKAQPSIQEQFPRLCNLAPVWFNPKVDPPTGLVKMMAYRANLATTRGGHVIQGVANYWYGRSLHTICRIQDTMYREKVQFQVHHFKWNHMALPKLKRRVEEYKKRGYSWWTYSQRFIDHFEKYGKILLDESMMYGKEYSSRR